MGRMKTGIVLAVGCIATALPSLVQAAPPEMERMLKKKYEIQQQQADAATARAEAEARRAQQARTANNAAAGPSAGSATYQGLSSNDPLEGKDVQSCTLANGSGIRVSGGFRPAPGSGANCNK